MRRFLLAVLAASVVSAVFVPGLQADPGPVVESCADAGTTSARTDPYRTFLEMPCDSSQGAITTLWAKLDRYDNPLELTIRMKLQVKEHGKWVTKDKVKKTKPIYRTRSIRKEHYVDPEMIFGWAEHHPVREVTRTSVCDIVSECHRERAIGHYN